MKLRISTGPRHCIVAVACLLAAMPVATQQTSGNQPSKGTPTKASSQSGEVRVEPIKVKQDFGPQQASRRGEQPTTATPPAQNTGTQTEKFKVKQEFGPQNPSRRGDGMTVVTPQGQGNTQNGTSQSSTPSATKNKPPQPTPKPATNKTNQAPQ